MDKSYWNVFYEQNKAVEQPSLFAQWVIEYMKKGGKVADLGCGNGRDSIFFMKNQMKVCAIDVSEVATKHIAETYGKQMDVVNDDFVTFLGGEKDVYEYLYSRFTVHAIDAAEQDVLLKNAYEALKEKGQMFIEVRCTKDELFGKGDLIAPNTYFYEGHSRRFIDKKELKQKLEEKGFAVLYTEEKRGFAPFGDSDPIVLRIIAEKQ